MITREFNGNNYQFPEGTTDEQIDKYFKKIDPNKRGLITDIGLSAIDGVRDGVQATIGLVEDLGDTLGEKTGFYGIDFGNDEEGFQLSDLKPNLVSYKEAQEKGYIDDKLTLPDFERDPDTVAGGITKGVTQFLTGWFSGGKLLKGVKATTQTGKLAKSVAKGSIADFQAFDQDSGRLVDMINEYAPQLENPLFDYLSSDENDTWYEARFKNALEGAGLGGAIEGVFRGIRWYKAKKQLSEGKPLSEKAKKQLAEDEKILSETPESELLLTKYRPVSKDLGDEVIKNLDKELEDGIFNAYKTAQDEFTKGGLKATDFEDFIDEMDISSQFNIKKMVTLNEQGLLSVDAWTKAYKKLADKGKIVISDEQVARSAERMYGGKQNLLEGDIKDLVGNVKNARVTIVAMNSYYSFLQNSSKRLALLADKEPKAKELFLKVHLPKLLSITESKKYLNREFGGSTRLLATDMGTKIADDQAKLLKELDAFPNTDPDEFIRKWGRSGNADVSVVLDAVRKNRTWDVANEIWINALLSNPKTHLINMSSNLFNMFLRPLEKTVGGLTGYLGGSAKAKLLREESGKALGTYVSMGRYLKDSVKYAGIALRKEDGILTSRNKLDTPKKSIQKTKLVDGKEVIDDSITGTVVNTLGKVVRMPSRFLTAEDEFFKQIQYRTHLERYAFDKAIRDGMSRDKIVAFDIKTKRPISEFDQALVDNFNNGFDQFGRARIKEVLKMAEEGTYTNELTGIFKRIGDTTNEFPILKQILPFTRTPVNLMLNVVDRTPLGFIRKQYRDDFFGRNGVERMAQARGQLATGFALMILANKLVAEGHITGVQGQIKGEKLTTSRELKQLKKGTGIIPYSFRYFDKETQSYKYREFGRFDPFGAFFGLVVDFHTFYDQLNEEEALRLGSNVMILLAKQGGDVSDYLSGGQKLGNALSAMGSSVTRNLVSKTYLKGLADFMEVITDDDPSKWGRYAKSKTGSFIPNIYTKFINDPFYRDTRSILDEVKKRSGTAEVEFKYDFRGNALRIQGDENKRLINGVFNPFGETTEKNDPVAKEIFRLGVNMPSMKMSLRGDVDLTLFVNDKGQTAYNRQQELLRKIRINGKSLDQRLQIAITSSGYKKLSDPRQFDKLNKDIGGKAKLLRSIIKDYHTEVEELLIKEAQQFKSVEDDTGKFTLFNSLDKQNQNLEKLKMGIELKPSDIQNLYNFSK
ncbi:internal virion protein D [Pelagibacter phage HTVC041P]|uniref:Internal virion protein D n=1 Tax=Pelagibacter phage HTVC041P TaxID=3072833 RepID=A0AAX4G2R0_9CAUD|nr:internal virion protein D [Pelagibacter phage HTVC041P]